MSTNQAKLAALPLLPTSGTSLEKLHVHTIHITSEDPGDCYNTQNVHSTARSLEFGSHNFQDQTMTLVQIANEMDKAGAEGRFALKEYLAKLGRDQNAAADKPSFLTFLHEASQATDVAVSPECTVSGVSEYEHAMTCKGVHPGRRVFSLNLLTDNEADWNDDSKIKQASLQFTDVWFSAEGLRMSGVDILKEFGKAGVAGQKAVDRHLERFISGWKVPSSGRRLVTVSSFYVHMAKNHATGHEFPKSIIFTVKIHKE
ncbi:hypothetical protein BJ508DRAFT_324727 [Ascobolus immersus RN42]|uniref:Uncharacterized protein n=1 Tax=Ascobolus immersus RN42 TaxID=1160509 RepID=A0A3N4INI5_ASCIM|nr:hypothetical protein BJ508DRAFT_324727 [Ascobolus immersus RN42]